MNPLHEVRDPEKVQRLAASMEANGWQGMPLVIWEVYGQLLTGVHRYEAAHEVLGWSDSEIPTIDIEDIFAEAGIDFHKALERYGNPWVTNYEFTRVLWELPEAIQAKYGIDWH